MTASKITREIAAEAMRRKQSSQEPLEKILGDLGLNETEIYKAAAEIMGVDCLRMPLQFTDTAVSRMLPVDLQERYDAFPIQREGDSLMVAMLRPNDISNR